MIDYSPLWETMKEKEVTQYYLLQHGIGSKTLYNIRRNRYISTLTVERLCKLIGCTPNDIMRFTD